MRLKKAHRKDIRLSSSPFDFRSITSKMNGAKGGRPAFLPRPTKIVITRADTLAAIKAGDFALGLELGLRRAFPAAKVRVQTAHRLSAASVNFDHQINNDLVFISGTPFRFTWEMKVYLTSFVNATKGSEDYVFFMKTPNTNPTIAKKGKQA